MSAAYRYCVNGLLTRYSVNIDRQAVWCVHYWHCVFIRCVGGYSLYVILQLLGLFYYCTRIGVSVLRTGRGRAGGGGGGRWKYWTEFFFSLRNVPGVLKRQKKKKNFGGGILGCLGRPTPPPGGRAGSENNTLLPMAMTCDRLKFWSGPAWRSKVIIRKPWRWKEEKKEEEKKKKKK